eukprot:14306213-Heterocapsa_arctica.AAC.1
MDLVSGRARAPLLPPLPHAPQGSSSSEWAHHAPPALLGSSLSGADPAPAQQHLSSGTAAVPHRDP